MLLDSLIASGAVTYRSTWKSTYPLLESTEAYQNLLGTTGSSPLDLFWDATDQLELRAESDLILVEKVVDEKIADFKEAMTYEEFVKVLEGDTRLAEVDYSSIKVIFDRVSLFSFTLWNWGADTFSSVTIELFDITETIEGEQRRSYEFRLMIYDTLLRNSIHHLISNRRLKM